MSEHPIRLTIADDLHRSRVTVFFRLLLAIPHLIWLFLWTLLVFLLTIVNWVATLAAGRSPDALHRFLGAYVRYTTHLYGYVFLAANPFPGFEGAPGTYPIDLEIDPPARQRRWVTLLRLPLALPALLVLGVLGATPRGAGGSWESDGGDAEGSAYFGGVGLAATIAVLGWFAALARGRMPHGFRNALAYVLRYSAQVAAYLLVLTDRYPDSDPTLPAAAGDREPGPIRLVVDDHRGRSRLTVFFRGLLVLPHLIWLALWTVAAAVAIVAAWFAALALGRVPAALHRFLAAYLCYRTHVISFGFLVANPFPGFTGQPGSYPVDLEIDGPARQHRLVTAFRLLLAVPALAVSGGLGLALFVVGFLGWFASLATGQMPAGLRELGAWAVRYSAETSAYLYLLTDRYPFSGPPVEQPEPEPEPEPVADAVA